MLEELSKHDELWRFYALKICGDEDYAKELVNDMLNMLSILRGEKNWTDTKVIS